MPWEEAVQIDRGYDQGYPTRPRHANHDAPEVLGNCLSALKAALENGRCWAYISLAASYDISRRVHRNDVYPMASRGLVSTQDDGIKEAFIYVCTICSQVCRYGETMQSYRFIVQKEY